MSNRQSEPRYHRLGSGMKCTENECPLHDVCVLAFWGKKFTFVPGISVKDTDIVCREYDKNEGKNKENRYVDKGV